MVLERGKRHRQRRVHQRLNASAVTNMSQAFRDRSSFNESSQFGCE